MFKVQNKKADDIIPARSFFGARVARPVQSVDVGGGWSRYAQSGSMRRAWDMSAGQKAQIR